MPTIFYWLNSKLGVHKLYNNIFNSIAFVPATLSVVITLLSFLMMYLDSQRLKFAITKYLGYIITHEPATARVLLSTLASGVLSLMVFSFSMVMVVLTMASNNYTPRVLPGLINQKSHQVVLGVYMGTIGYTIVVLINIGSNAYNFIVPVLSVLVATLLVFTCLIAFIYFIRSISNNIQIGSILNSLFLQTCHKLDEERKHSFVKALPEELVCRSTVITKQAGYFQEVQQDVLVALAQQENAVIEVLAASGQYLLAGAAVMKSNKAFSETQLKDLEAQVTLNYKEHVQISYMYGFKHITEVAVKALSPGINDPGSALNAIDYLTQLYCLLLHLNNYQVIEDKQGVPRLYMKKPAFETLFLKSFTSIRNYATTDVNVQQKLLWQLSVLEEQPKAAEHRELFAQERNALLANAKATLQNETDKHRIEKNS